MTPTLEGRWQTRGILFLLVALPITFLFALYQADFDFTALTQRRFSIPFKVVIALFCVGLVMDPFYILIQNFRWDRDWPFILQFLSLILEFLIVLGLIKANLIPGISPFDLDRAPHRFFYHFAFVFIPSYLILVAGLQIFFLRWRFKGGELGRFRT